MTVLYYLKRTHKINKHKFECPFLRQLSFSLHWLKTIEEVGSARKTISFEAIF